jgi:hypothetical protein
MIELNVAPVLTDEQLEALRFQPLTPVHCKPITSSTRVICEGKLKALFLKAEEYQPIAELSYKAALRGLRAMNFTPAHHSRRAAVKQNLGGSSLLLGWMKTLTPEREDIFRAGHRDHFIPAMWLVPLLKDFEQALQEHLPEYWQFHRVQAQRLVRPKREHLKTLDKVSHYYERKMLEQWDETRHYLFPGTEAFSSVQLNQNIRFLPHTDGRNVPGTLSCLATAGAFSGGPLGFPRLGISFDIQPGDLLIADTNEEYHGTVGGIFGNRYSVVAYLHESLLPKAA